MTGIRRNDGDAAANSADFIVDGEPNKPQVDGRRRCAKRAKKEVLPWWRAKRIARNGGPLGATFPRRHKWLGGVVDLATGNMYGILSHSHQVICIATPPPPVSSSAMGAAERLTILLPNKHQLVIRSI